MRRPTVTLVLACLLLPALSAQASKKLTKRDKAQQRLPRQMRTLEQRVWAQAHKGVGYTAAGGTKVTYAHPDGGAPGRIEVSYPNPTSTGNQRGTGKLLDAVVRMPLVTNRANTPGKESDRTNEEQPPDKGEVSFSLTKSQNGHQLMVSVTRISGSSGSRLEKAAVLIPETGPPRVFNSRMTTKAIRGIPPGTAKMLSVLLDGLTVDTSGIPKKTRKALAKVLSTSAVGWKYLGPLGDLAEGLKSGI